MVTYVLMRSQIGILSLTSEGQVEEIWEKSLMRDHRVNAGFIVFEPEAFDLGGAAVWSGTFCQLAARKSVYGYWHDGFFKSVDSYKNVLEFEELIESGEAPWLTRV